VALAGNRKSNDRTQGAPNISKEQATAAALRKIAEGHDVSIQAPSHHEKGTRGEGLQAMVAVSAGG
jgi:hypothetical protein